jgi:hypothetical protein
MKTAATVLLSVLCFAPQAAAQPSATFAQLVAQHRLVPGDRLHIVDARGKQHTGTLMELTPDLLTMRIDGDERQIREADVRRIIQQGFGHAKVYGALAGAGAGLVLAASFASAYGENEGGHFCGTCFVLAGAGLVPAGAGIGVGLGALIDHGNRKTVFIAPRSPSITIAPALGRRSIGLSLIARF